MSFKPFKSVGIGVTFSPNLKANIYEASRLSLMFNSKLILIHVGEETAEKKDTFTNILAPFLNQNLSVDIIFKSGNPVDVILSVSQNKNIDLLILGALKKEKLVNSILLLINPSIERIACQNIVVNGLKDPKTEQAIESAFYISHCLGSKMVTIVEEINQDEVAIKVEDDKSLRKATILKERIKLRETTRIKSIVEHIPKEHTDLVTIKSQPIFGKKGYSIGHYAQISRADLLVMNAPSKTTIWDRIFPHDIEHILAELPTDVLIIQ